MISYKKIKLENERPFKSSIFEIVHVLRIKSIKMPDISSGILQIKMTLFYEKERINEKL